MDSLRGTTKPEPRCETSSSHLQTWSGLLSTASPRNI
jgi:hypothetical protein